MVIFRFLVLPPPMRFGIISEIWMPISSMPDEEKISKGAAWVDFVSISIVAVVQFPRRAAVSRNFSRLSTKVWLVRFGSPSGPLAALRVGGSSMVEEPFLGVPLRLLDVLGHALRLDQVDGDAHQVADDRFHVAADVADLGELGGLDLEEGRPGELGQAAGDLGLADAGGADHQDVLGHDLVAPFRPAAAAGASGCAGRWRPTRLALCWPMMYLSSSATICLRGQVVAAAR